MMNRFYKQLLFIILGVVIITAGGLVIWAVNNRGAAPVMWLKFDEGYGTSAYDASGNSNTGAITNAVWKNEPECRTGKCLYFDGTGDYVTVSDSSELRSTRGITVETWVRPNDFDSTASLILKDTEYSLDIAQGVPNFRAYANSQWWAAQGAERGWLFREPFDNQLSGDASASFTEAFGYRALTPTALTAQKGILITDADGTGSGAGDNLQYSRGSQSTPDGTNVVYENFDPNQGTLEFWVRPNWDGDDGVAHDLFYEYSNSDNYIILTKTSANNLALGVKLGGVGSTASVSVTSWTAGTWYHVVAVWDLNNTVNGSNYTQIYWNSSNTGGSTSQPSAPASIESAFDIGHSGGNTQFNGTIAGRILNRPLTSTEVSALYASGAGHTDTFTVTPDTVWLGTYTDSTTTAAYWHRGKSVSAITDGGTEDTLTTASNADASFSDNDRVVVYDGTGYKIQGCVDGAPGSTSFDVDDCAGADPGTTEKVGVHAHLNGSSEYFYCTDANCDETGIVGSSLTIQAWIKRDNVTAAHEAIVSKADSSDTMYSFYTNLDELQFDISHGGTSSETSLASTDANLQANKWYHVAFTYNSATGAGDFYVNGYTVTDNGTTLASIYDGTPPFRVGTGLNGTSYEFDGSIAHVALFNDVRTAAEVLTSATTPNEDLSAAGNIIGQWHFNEAAAATAIDNTQGDAGRDLTPYDGGDETFGNVGRTQEAFVSKNLIADGHAENGGVGGWDVDRDGTFTKDTSTVKFDAQSLKITNGDATQTTATSTITTADGEDYYFNGWFRTPATVATSSILVDVEASSSLSFLVDSFSTSTTAQIAPSTWYEVDYVFQLNDASTVISLGSGSVTNAEIGYWDNVKLLPNLVDNGGMEGTYTSSESAIETETAEGNVTITNGGNTLTDTGKSWTNDEWIGYALIGDADGAAEEHIITDNDATSLTIEGTWALATGNYDYDIKEAAAPGWADYDSRGYLSRESSSQHSGTYAQKIYSVTGQSRIKQDVAVTVGKYYTVSVWVKAGSGSSGSVSIYDNPTWTTIGTFDSTSWTKVSKTVKIANAASIYLTVGTINAVDHTVYVDDVSVVELDTVAPTTATPSTQANSFGTGKWSDTNGAFLVDGGDVLSYPISGNINAASGTIAMWVKPSWPWGVTEYHGFFGTPASAGTWTNRLQILYDVAGTYIGFRIGATSTDALQCDQSVTNLDWSANAWHHIAYTYDAGSHQAIAYIDGTATSTCSTYKDAITIQNPMYIGYNGYGQSDAHIDDVRIYDTVLSATDISNLYNDTKQTTVTANQWSHLAGVYSKDDSNLKIYKNGVLQNTYTTPASYKLGTSTNNITIGDEFTGYLDEPRIYDYARSASQIAADYTAAGSLRGASGRSVTVGEGQDPSEGLVAYWAMDESSWGGTTDEVVDSSGNGNHGVRVGDANTTSTAKYGMAGNFDGTGDYVDLGISNTLKPSQFTLSAWAKFNTLSGASDAQSVLSSNNGGSYGCELGMAQNGVPALLCGDGSSWDINITSSAYSVGIWYHLVASYDGTTARFYINGVEVGSDTGSVVYDSSNTYIGYRGYSGWLNPMDGQIDDVKIYNTARTAAQIRRDYETGPPPVAHWKFDEGSGSTLYDTAGSNDGSLDLSYDPSTSTAWTRGRYGSALNFDGTDDFITVSDHSSLDTGNGATIEAWVYDKGSDSSTYYLCRCDGWSSEFSYAFGPLQSGIWTSFSNTGAGLAGYHEFFDVPFATSTWTHVAAAYDGATTKVYLNGVLASSTNAITGSVYRGSGALYIGSRNAANYPCKGIIDDVRIYNYARTQKQIIQDMNAGHPAVGSPVGSYVGYWRFDEGYGDTAYDMSLNLNNGDLAGSATTCPTSTASECPTWTTNGKFGKALSFDGTDDYVDLGDITDLDGLKTLTLAAWIKTSDVGDFDVIVGKTYLAWNYALMGGGSNKFEFTIDGTNDAVSNSALNDGTWHHLVGTYDGNLGSANLKLYVDGVLQSDTGDYTTAIADTADRLAIGTALDSNFTVGSADYTFNGTIDEVKIYPFALTPEEIKQEYNRGSTLVLGAAGTSDGAATSAYAALREYCVPGDTSQCDPPVAHWKFDERSGSTLYDISTSQNTGTLHLGPTGTAQATTSVWKSAGSCHTGGCLSFDGVDDYVDAGNGASLSPTEAITVEGWTKTLDKTAHQKLISRDLSYIFTSFADPNLHGWQVYVDGGWRTFNITKTFQNNVWYHFAATYDSTTRVMKIFRDGVEIGSNTLSGLASYTINSSSNATLIGSYVGGYLTKGLIDDVRIYNYARTQAQIAWDYNRGKPIAHWTMDSVGYAANGSSTIYDAMGSNDGTYYNEIMNNGTTTASTKPTWRANRDCKYGTCLDFDGTDDYLDCGDATDTDLDIGASTTVAAWVRFDTLPSSDLVVVLSKDAGGGGNNKWVFGYANNYSGIPNALFVHKNTGGGSSEWASSTAWTPNTDQWYHVAVVKETNDYTFYVDGASQGSGYTMDEAAPAVAYSVHIGEAEGSFHFDGRIDDVRMYDINLTAAQVLALYLNNDRSAGASLEGNLVGEWRFDEGDGDYMADTHYQRDGARNYAMNFDGTDDYVSVSDNNVFSFGDSSTDKPFSISAWVKMDDATNFMIVNKGVYNTDYEWNFATEGTDWLIVQAADESVADCRIGRRYNTAMTSYQGQWIHVATTYDASEASSGFRLYLNGVRVDDTDHDLNAGSYVAMENLTHDVWIGQYNALYANGLIDDVKIFNYALTETQIKNDYNQSAARFGPSSGLP